MGTICCKCRKKRLQRSDPLKYKHLYDYDLIVIGGGSGGIAAAIEAASASQQVLLCDFVVPSPMGSTWGLGGTCTNVGCVPKKLMHAAGLVGDTMRLASSYGYTSIKPILKKSSTTLMSGAFEHNWKQLIEDVQDHIQSLSWKYRVTCNNNNIEYINAYAQFLEPHKILARKRNGEERIATGNHFVLAIGGRPKYLDIPGGRKEDALCITSDDLFSLPYPPGKVLIIGGSYIALECAGFLVSLNYEVTVVVRSILLRGFDQDMANRIRLHLQSLGVLFRMEFEPKVIRKVEDGNPPKLEVTVINVSENKKSVAYIPKVTEVFNTVLLAVGREPSTGGLDLGNASVKLAKNGKIIVNKADRTTARHIYAVGDCAEGRSELAPLAIKAGKLLAKRLYWGSTALTDYVNVPTTVYTPIEYGCVGLAEEDARAKYGESDIEVYHTLFQPIEYVLPRILPKTCYAKLICVKSRNEEVVGLHYFGPNAGEVVQGFALGFKFKATKQHYDALVGIHPTCAERFTTLMLKKSSGEDVLNQDDNC